MAAIVQIAQDFCEAWKTGNLATIMDAYSTDAIKMNQGVPNRGKEELERGYADLLSKYDVHVAVKVEEVKIISDLFAFDRVTFTSRAIPKGGGTALLSRGRLLEVLRKENGKWKSLRAMSTLDDY